MMPTCEICGFEAKTYPGLKAHQRLKHPEGIVSTPMPAVESVTASAPANVTVDPVLSPAIIPKWNERVPMIQVSIVGREIKMLRPICATCQRGKVPVYWWKDCPHDKYTHPVQSMENENRYEDEIVDGVPTGRKRLVAVDNFQVWVEEPNWVQLSMNRRIASMTVVQRKRRMFGFILPHELRSPGFPAGIADPCEFRDCFRQEGLMNTRWGRFCRDEEWQLVGHDHRMSEGGGALEVGDTQQSLDKQREQLSKVPR